ncbi:MAG: hypothetical protein KF698_03180 [Anaerolineales bacterium]|nr:hypothetical protein [Anaerolineales bacterium]
MPKVFYTERDIEDLARQGVTSLTITEDTVLTELAREKARRAGIALVDGKDSRTSAAASPAASSPAAAKPAAGELEARVFTAVKAKLGSQVDETLLRTIVQRVIKSLGK